MDAFQFFTKLDQTLLLSLQARSSEELLNGIRTQDSSIYFHTHHFLQQHHFLLPEPPNDFAYWVTEVLGDDNLGEQLCSAPEYARQLGINGREHVRNNYLITRHLKDYLLLFVSLMHEGDVVYL